MIRKEASVLMRGKLWRGRMISASDWWDAPIAIEPARPNLSHEDFPAVIDLTNLDPDLGFVIRGDRAGDTAGTSVSSAGDMNGDGIDDMIVGAPAGDNGGPNAGEAYVIFGQTGAFGTVDLTSFANGFILRGEDGDFTGASVSEAGDVNGDGFADIVIGAPYADGGGTDSGAAYVVFGKPSGLANLVLPNLNGSNGFVINGADPGNVAGSSVSSAGDVNGDGFDDIIIGAPRGNDGGSSAGEAYVIFGKASGFGTIDLGALPASDGFVIQGDNSFEYLGFSAAGAGDVNGDGFDDMIVGAPYAQVDSFSLAGRSYVIFGKDGGFGRIDLSNLTAAQGFALSGGDDISLSGFSVSSAGDVNGDGFTDTIVGAPQSPGGGKAFVIFGKATPGQIDLSNIDPEDGFTITGDSTGDRAGSSVSSAGDVNGDGFDDIILGAPFGEDGTTQVGEAYLIFGKAGGFADIDLTGFSVANADGFLISGDAEFDDAGRAVSSAGDINGDGFDDMMVGAPRGDDGGAEAGEAYVLYGEAPSTAVQRGGAAGDQTIRGGDFNDTLSGLGGDDTLDGGGGRDRITGGAGKDRILLESTSVGDADTIFGFAPGKDKLLLDGSVYGLPAGSLNPSRFVVGNQAQDANERLIYKAGVGKLYFDPDGNGAAQQQLIATLSGAPVLGAGDFVVI